VNLAPSLAAAERAAIRAELAGDPARPLLVAVGRLSHQKGYGDLLTAFATLRQTHPHAALIIAGGGGRHAELSAQIASLHLDHHAWLLGARNDVPRLLAASDIFVSASHWEGLPVAVLEAMAAGLPIVATSVGDVPRVVSAEAGLIVPPHQPDLLAGALRTLLDNPVQRQRLGEAARAYVTRNHSPARCGKTAAINRAVRQARGGDCGVFGRQQPVQAERVARAGGTIF
ncbi:MAG: glycosyltransferase, partial [Anaerolineales bacterium]